MTKKPTNPPQLDLRANTVKIPGSVKPKEVLVTLLKPYSIEPNKWFK